MEADAALARRLQGSEQSAGLPRERWAAVHMRAHREAARRYASQSAPPRRTFDSARVPLYLNKLNRAAESRAGASPADPNPALTLTFTHTRTLTQPSP